MSLREACDGLRELEAAYQGRRSRNAFVGASYRRNRAKYTQRISELDAATPPCAQAMKCLCAGHARGNAPSTPCDTSEGVRS